MSPASWGTVIVCEVDGIVVSPCQYSFGVSGRSPEQGAQAQTRQGAQAQTRVAKRIGFGPVDMPKRPAGSFGISSADLAFTITRFLLPPT